ncbi:transposase [Legionella pneumophila]|nr:transposase [Legionella pneumophila]MDI9845086.1 transposase [Legionella pneumophila]
MRGRSEGDLSKYLRQLPGKERVKVVCMDLSSTYRSLVKKHFGYPVVFK